jgi:hypothetical protein
MNEEISKDTEREMDKTFRLRRLNETNIQNDVKDV